MTIPAKTECWQVGGAIYAHKLDATKAALREMIGDLPGGGDQDMTEGQLADFLYDAGPAFCLLATNLLAWDRSPEVSTE